jgi:hypothetical protein
MAKAEIPARADFKETCLSQTNVRMGREDAERLARTVDE